VPKNSNHQWTTEEDDRLLELQAAGKSRISIAAALRRSAKTIPSRLYILKTKLPALDHQTGKKSEKLNLNQRPKFVRRIGT
jgi:DNA-binding NarL/FixJ family response regulator